MIDNEFKEKFRILAKEYEKIPGARYPHDWGFHLPDIEEIYEDLKKCVTEGRRHIREPLPEGAIE